MVAKVTDIIGREGKDVKSTFSTSSAGSSTDVLGGYIAELPIYRYQYVTLVRLTMGYQDVQIQCYAVWPSYCGRDFPEPRGSGDGWTSPRRLTACCQHVTLIGLTSGYQDVSVDNHIHVISRYGTPLQFLADVEGEGLTGTPYSYGNTHQANHYCIHARKLHSSKNTLLYSDTSTSRRTAYTVTITLI